MATVLITGSEEFTQEIAKAVTEAGGDPITASSQAEFEQKLTGVEKGSVASYIQLPVAVSMSGDSMTGRVLSFLEQGIIGRFRAATAINPYLAADASVVLVAGNSILDNNNTTPDDREARLHLVHVLARALRAEADTTHNVQVVHRSVGTRAIIAAALKGERLSSTSPDSVDPNLGYDDWRTEVLGMATTEI